MALLAAKNLTNPHLTSASLTLKAGECVALSGPSGSGKSVLLRALADLDPNEGDVRLKGKSRAEYNAPNWRARVRYQAAEPGWWADTAGEHFTKPQDLDLTGLGLTLEILAKPVLRLSTGERQRLALLRSFEGSPDILLLDEPTAALDPQSVTLAEAMIAKFTQAGGAVLLVSHDPAQAARLASRKLHMAAGRLVDD